MKKIRNNKIPPEDELSIKESSNADNKLTDSIEALGLDKITSNNLI